MLKEGNMQPTDKQQFYHNDLIKTLKTFANASAGYI